jgi:hypothetical protein
MALPPYYGWGDEAHPTICPCCLLEAAGRVGELEEARCGNPPDLSPHAKQEYQADSAAGTSTLPTPSTMPSQYAEHCRTAWSSDRWVILIFTVALPGPSGRYAPGRPGSTAGSTSPAR